MKNEPPFGTEPIINNVVASGRFPNELDIAKIYLEIDFVEAEYEPENYPALLVKILVNGKKRHITIYKNGKFIITGAKSEKEVFEIYKEILKILKEKNYI